MYHQQEVVSRYPRGMCVVLGGDTSYRQLAYMCENQHMSMNVGISGILFCGILLVPHNIVMDLNNFMKYLFKGYLS
jgi:hypothetical protein